MDSLVTVVTVEKVEELGEVSIVSMIPHNCFLKVEKIRQNGGHDPCHPTILLLFHDHGCLMGSLSMSVSSIHPALGISPR